MTGAVRYSADRYSQGLGRTVYHVRKVADWEGLHTPVLVEEGVRRRVRHLVLQRERG